MTTSSIHEVSSHLINKGLNPIPTWTTTFVNGQRHGIPAAALKQTAFFRIAASDITTTLQTSSANIFPTNALDANIKEQILGGPIAVQVLNIEDIGKSKWSQIEAIEADERGETTRGREIIRVVPSPAETTDALLQIPVTSVTSLQSLGPHKLLLQDAKGTKIYALEVSSIDGINMNMNIGTKMVLKGLMIARGVVLINPQTTTILGGKLEELHQVWRREKKAKLTIAVTNSVQ